MTGQPFRSALQEWAAGHPVLFRGPARVHNARFTARSLLRVSSGAKLPRPQPIRVSSMRYGVNYQTAFREPPGGAGGSRAPGVHARRRRWSSRDVHDLERWAGMRSMSELSRTLRRSERALRCKMQRLGMSAKVNDGWGPAQLRTELHLGPRHVLREVSKGRLCIQNAEVRTSGALVRADGGIAPLSAPLGKFASSMQLTCLQVCELALEGRWRVVHMRISDASVHQFCHYGLLGERAGWLSPALRWWLAPVVMRGDDAPCSDRLPRHLRTLHLCPVCGRQVRGNAYFRHASSHHRAVATERDSERSMTARTRRTPRSALTFSRPRARLSLKRPSESRPDSSQPSCLVEKPKA